MRLLFLVLTVPLWLGASEAVGAERSAYQECHAQLLLNCDCDAAKECLKNAGEKGNIDCTATQSEEASTCSSPPCLASCVVMLEIEETK